MQFYWGSDYWIEENTLGSREEEDGQVSYIGAGGTAPGSTACPEGSLPCAQWWGTASRISPPPQEHVEEGMLVIPNLNLLLGTLSYAFI